MSADVRDIVRLAILEVIPDAHPDIKFDDRIVGPDLQKVVAHVAKAMSLDSLTTRFNGMNESSVGDICDAAVGAARAAKSWGEAVQEKGPDKRQTPDFP